MKYKLSEITSTILSSLLLFLPVILISLPSFSLAQGKNAGKEPTAAGSVRLENPLQFKTFNEFMVGILNVVIVLAIPVVVFFIILAGFKYVTARGNAAETQKATAALTYAVIGGVLILGAVTIAEIIKNLVDSFAATP